MTDKKDFYDIIGIEPNKNLTIDNSNTNIISKEELDKIQQSESQIESDFDEDFQKVKMNFEYIVNTIKNHVPDIAAIASEKESAKEYDALNNMLRTMNDVSANMITLHEKRKKFKDKKLPVNITNTENKTQNNVIFTGSTKDLEEYIKKIKSQN